MHTDQFILAATNPVRRSNRLALIAPLALSLLLPATALAEQGTISSNGVHIHFVDEGEGETVVFLHGFAGSSDMWSAIGLTPMSNFRTIALDARGHGSSGRPDDASAYGLTMVDDVVAVMEARGVTKAHFVGYSMGAETALKLAVIHPDRVASLIIAGSGWSGEAEAEAYSFVSGALSENETFGSFMAAMAPPDQDMPPEAQAAMLELLAAHGIDPEQPTGPLAVVAAALPEIIDLDAAELSAITAPVLGLAGSDDPEHDNVARLAGPLPNFTFVSIEDADHLMAPLSPDFASAVFDFLGN
ncbi:alpha/beta hydrolase [uncultured Devosia sp.]|uniref:alpha/beta fold hydrolase n=1 Tax=uncultured Devosia sp. TaxID=211434 RepID=UPI002621695D|nr:alpha/beta hydrolase [uncultured Devosia sp.]